MVSVLLKIPSLQCSKNFSKKLGPRGTCRTSPLSLGLFIFEYSRLSFSFSPSGELLLYTQHQLVADSARIRTAALVVSDAPWRARPSIVTARTLHLRCAIVACGLFSIVWKMIRDFRLYLSHLRFREISDGNRIFIRSEGNVYCLQILILMYIVMLCAFNSTPKTSYNNLFCFMMQYICFLMRNTKW